MLNHSRIYMRFKKSINFYLETILDPWPMAILIEGDP